MPWGIGIPGGQAAKRRKSDPKGFFGADLTLWLDGADSSTITTSSTKITNWADKSGKGSRDFAQATDANRPTYDGSLNTYTVPQFNGTSQYMTSSVLLSSLIKSTTPTYYGVYMVIQPNSDQTENGTAYLNPGVISDANAYLAPSVCSGKVIAYHFDASAKDVRSAISNNTAYQWRQKYDATNINSKLNNGSNSTVAAGDVGALGNSMVLGANYNHSKYFKGLLAEVVVVKRNANSTDDTNMYNYFKGKWNIS